MIEMKAREMKKKKIYVHFRIKGNLTWMYRSIRRIVDEMKYSMLSLSDADKRKTEERHTAQAYTREIVFEREREKARWVWHRVRKRITSHFNHVSNFVPSPQPLARTSAKTHPCGPLIPQGILQEDAPSDHSSVISFTLRRRRRRISRSNHVYLCPLLFHFLLVFHYNDFSSPSFLPPFIMH